jgi:DNA primase
MEGVQVSWQARYIGELDWKATKIPKYWTCPGTRKSLALYGYDDAIGMPFVVLMEGPTDVCAFGAGAVAMMGKALSPVQQRLLQDNWQKVVLLLDGEAFVESEMLCRELMARRQVVHVQLPDGIDPAAALAQDRDYLFDLIYGTARMSGVDLAA